MRPSASGVPLASDLREATANSRLEVHYQVQTSVANGEIKGFEALARWKLPERGYVSPAEFIPPGLILQLGEWILRRASADAATWDSSYSVAINVSPLHFAHADLAAFVMAVLLENQPRAAPP